MKKNPNPNSTGHPAENVASVVNPASEFTPVNGISKDNSTRAITISPLQPETINSLESLPLEQRFIGLVEQGIQAWIKAGELLVEMTSKQGDKAFKSILQSCPWMNEAMLWNFYRIGQKKLFPKTLIFSANQTIAREIASLPWDVQAEICELGLPVLEGDRLVRKPVAELDRSDIGLGISDGTLNSLSTQLRFVSERKASGRSTNPRKQNSDFAPELDMPPDKPAATNLVSTGFYRVDFKFGMMTLVKIPKPKVPTQTIALRTEIGNFSAFIEVLRPMVS